MDKRLIIKRGEVIPSPGKGGMEQSASAGKVSTLVVAPAPPVITRPAMGKLYAIQTTTGRFSSN